MNRFNKNLTINIAEDTLNTNYSPIRGTHEKEQHPFEDHVDSQDDKQKITQPKLNLIEFQQFTVEKSRKKKQEHKEKRQFNIQIPDSKGKQSYLKNNNNTFKTLKNSDQFKQPPAPSKGSTKNKIFVFPIKNQQNKQQNDHQQWERLEILKLQFQRQRLEFYKEKSRFQKQLLIKDGQIQMLQKIVTEKYGGNIKKNHNYGEKQLIQIQNLLVQKDIQINQLFQKFNIIHQNLQRKNQQINKLKYQNMHLETIIQSLKNQLFIYQKKDNNEKLTKQFYMYRPQSTINKWDQQISRAQFGMRGMEELQKRMQLLKFNRIQLQQRGKIKSQVSYSQTSKNKSKGIFDFKNKLYDQTRIAY